MQIACEQAPSECNVARLVAGGVVRHSLGPLDGGVGHNQAVQPNLEHHLGASQILNLFIEYQWWAAIMVPKFIQTY